MRNLLLLIPFLFSCATSDPGPVPDEAALAAFQAHQQELEARELAELLTPAAFAPPPSTCDPLECSVGGLGNDICKRKCGPNGYCQLRTCDLCGGVCEFLTGVP